MMGIADAGSIIEPWLAAVIFTIFGGVLLAFAALWAACWVREEWRRKDREGATDDL